MSNESPGRSERMKQVASRRVAGISTALCPLHPLEEDTPNHCYMPLPVALEPSRKRQASEDDRSHLHHPQKRVKTNPPPPSAYWDSLSKIWLTKDALQELDRRNSASINVQEPRHIHRPLTRRLQATLKHHYQTLPHDPLDGCTPKSRKEIKRLSRRGGPDLSDIRNFPDPYIPLYRSMSANSSGRQKRRAESPPGDSNNKTTKTTSTTPYNRNFEQKLIDHGIYPPGYKYPNGRRLAKPSNWLELNERLTQSRASLTEFSEHDFDEFVEADTNASKEKPITRFAIPAIEGRVNDIRCMGGDFPFKNLAPLTDGTLATAKPDHFFGARPEQLEPQIRSELDDFIIPSTQDSLPILPNFFLEAKGPDGFPIVATRQACYVGALGARGIHKLQSYKQDEPIYDQNAYTITSTYIAGTLKLYTTHLIAPQERDGRPEYIMTQLKGWSMTSDLETFRKGASAYRNAQDWAKEQRDKFITAANERHRRTQSLVSGHETTSEPTATLDSDTSATSDEAEFHGTAEPNQSASESGNAITNKPSA